MVWKNMGLHIGISSGDHSVESTYVGREKLSIGFDLDNDYRGLIDEEGSDETNFLSSYV